MKSDFFYKKVLPLVALAVIFLLVSYLADCFHSTLAIIVEAGGIWGVIGFIVLTTLFVVFIIPLDIIFLIPLGTVVFGPVQTALMSIFGWVLGATIAFGIARYFGRPVVERLISLKRIRAVEARIPKHNIFWSVVLLRLLISVDILSYALGLTSLMSWRSYVLATLIGVTPFGFFFAYTGSLPFMYRIVSIVVALMLATLVVVKYGFVRTS